MQRFLSIAMVLCLALTFSFEAHAKRLGGGFYRPVMLGVNIPAQQAD